jgi:CRISPR-associated endoribonuclease Cas6
MQHIDLALQKRDISSLNCELAVRIHGWLMSRVSTDYAKSMHTPDELRPFSLFTRVQPHNIVLRLSLLHETAAPISNALKNVREISISGIDGSLSVLNRVEKAVITPYDLQGRLPGEFKVIIASPASFKHNGRVSNMYSLPALLYPAAAKLRKFEGIDIPDEEVAALCEQVSYPQYEIRSAEYKIKPNIQRPGFEGNITLRPGGGTEQRKKMALLLRYAAYTGMGAKTALGMGGILLMES